MGESFKNLEGPDQAGLSPFKVAASLGMQVILGAYGTRIPAKPIRNHRACA